MAVVEVVVAAVTCVIAAAVNSHGFAGLLEKTGTPVAVAVELAVAAAPAVVRNVSLPGATWLC